MNASVNFVFLQAINLNQYFIMNRIYNLHKWIGQQAQPTWVLFLCSRVILFAQLLLNWISKIPTVTTVKLFKWKITIDYSYLRQTHSLTCLIPLHILSDSSLEYKNVPNLVQMSIWTQKKTTNMCHSNCIYTTCILQKFISFWKLIVFIYMYILNISRQISKINVPGIYKLILNYHRESKYKH